MFVNLVVKSYKGPFKHPVEVEFLKRKPITPSLRTAEPFDEQKLPKPEVIVNCSSLQFIL